MVDQHWALFDVLLVSMSWIEFVMTLTASGVSDGGMGQANLGKILKIARMARILRAIRMIRFFTKIRLMVVMILGSFMSLFWLVLLLTGVIYVFAVVLTSGATDW